MNAYRKRSRSQDGNIDLAVVELVDKVNGNVIESILSKWDASERDASVWRKQLEKVQQSFLEKQKENVQLQVDNIALRKRYELSVLARDTCIGHLESSAVDAARSVTEDLSSLQNIVQNLELEIAGKKEYNETLLKDVEKCMRFALDEVSKWFERALKAELQIASQDVKLSRLQATYSYEQLRHRNRMNEINILMKIVKMLADKSKEVNNAVSELARTRAHVRLLENQLDLNGIVAAHLPEDFEVETPAERHKRRNPDAPPFGLRKVAPNYFALRMLEHKDLTLSDLVESWFEQERKINEADEKYAQLKAQAKVVQENAAIVEQKYLEEKERRERSDRRITEMIRERLLPKDSASVVENLNELRWNYDQLLDDSTKLAVSLQFTREDLDKANDKIAEQNDLINQLKINVQTDEIAKALFTLRTKYEENIQSLQNDFIDAVTNRDVLAKIAEQQNENAAAAIEALDIEKDNYLSMMDNVQALVDEGRKQKMEMEKESQRITKLLDHNASLHIAQFEKLQSYLEQMDVVRKSTSMRDSTLLNDYAKKIVELSGAFKELLPVEDAVRNLHENKMEAVNRIRASESKELMHRALLTTLDFTSKHVALIEEQRSDLLDESLSDLHNINRLTDRMEKLQEENKALKVKLEKSVSLINRYNLNVLEDALQHPVTVEDSLDIEEATSQIARLQEDNAVLVQTNALYLKELTELRSNQEELENKLKNTERKMDAAQEDVNHIRQSLHSSFERETNLRKENVKFQSRVDALSQIDFNLDVSEKSESFATVLEQFRSQLGELTDALKNSAALRTAEKEDTVEARKSLEEQILKSGLPGLTSLLQETFAKAQLLKGSLSRESVRNTLNLAHLALDESELSPEVINAKLQEELQQLRAEREQMQSRLTELEKAQQKLTTLNKSVFDISVKLKEKNKLLEQEKKDLQQRLEVVSSQRVEPPVTQEVAAPITNSFQNSPPNDVSNPMNDDTDNLANGETTSGVSNVDPSLESAITAGIDAAPNMLEEIPQDVPPLPPLPQDAGAPVTEIPGVTESASESNAATAPLPLTGEPQEEIANSEAFPQDPFGIADENPFGWDGPDEDEQPEE